MHVRYQKMMMFFIFRGFVAELRWNGIERVKAAL